MGLGEARLEVGPGQQPGGSVADDCNTHPDAPDSEVQGNQELSRAHEPVGRINSAIAP
jgi:hypothetical protein